MSQIAMRRLAAGVLVLGGVVSSLAQAAVINRRASRFDAATIADPAWEIGVRAESPEAIPGFDDERAGWTAFRTAHGGSWTPGIDRRSGVPLLVEGAGLRWFAAGTTPAISRLESLARAFVGENARASDSSREIAG